MARPNARPRRIVYRVGVAAAFFPLFALSQAPAFPQGASPPPPPDRASSPAAVSGSGTLRLGSAAAGESLFSGATRFANGGPPCLSCHDIAGLAFPHGGILGPDLTVSWAKYGPLALAPVLNTLYFPTMVPIFTTRPLTPAERGDLAAFLQAEAGRTPSAGTTGELLAAAAAGMGALLVLAWRAWPRRIGSVRRDLLERIERSSESKP